MAPLYTGLSRSDAQGIAQRLAGENVQYVISPDGSTISVPADKLDQLRVEMSQQGPPQSGRLGFELFDKPNWSGSDFSEKVNYQRALEGESSARSKRLTTFRQPASTSSSRTNLSSRIRTGKGRRRLC